MTVDLARGTAVGDGADTLAGVESVMGSAFADTLTGDAQNNWLTGRGGDDTLTGGDGVDTASYEYAPNGVTVDLARGTATGDGTDRLAGIETAVGSAFADALTGDGGANRLVGGSGDDTLVGGSGSDHLSGGGGNDVLAGGAGADRFVLQALPPNAAGGPVGSMDRLTDFEHGVDHLDLTAFKFTSLDDLATLVEPAGPDTLIHLSQVGGDDARIVELNVFELSPDDILI